MGATIGVAMQAGIARFGDAEDAVNLLKEVGAGTPLGKILEAARLSRERSSASKTCPWSKDRLCGLDPRLFRDGCDVCDQHHGGRPHGGLLHCDKCSQVRRFCGSIAGRGPVELSRNLQIATAAIDSTGMCLFIAFAVLDQPETFQPWLTCSTRSTA